MRISIFICLFLISCGSKNNSDSIPDISKDTAPKQKEIDCKLNKSIEQLMQLNLNVYETYDRITRLNTDLNCNDGEFNHLYLHSGAVFYSVMGKKLFDLKRELGAEDLTNFISSFINKKECGLGKLDLNKLNKIKACDWL